MPQPSDRATIRQRLGRRSEQLAAQVLRSRGYRLEATNVRYPVGEIDVVAWDQDTLCFIEVRSTSSGAWGGPLASLTARKRRRMIRAARWHLHRRSPLPPFTRFDVVAIEWHDHGDPTVELIQGACEADEQP